MFLFLLTVTMKICGTLKGTKHLPREQRLNLETPGWEVLDYERYAGSPAEVERQRERIMRAHLVVRDTEYPFAENVIVVETRDVDPHIGIMAKDSCFIETLRLGRSYELVYQLWAQFTLSAGRINVEVMWSHKEVLVGICTCCVSSTSHHVGIYFVACSLYHSQWDVPSDVVWWHQLGEVTSEL